jgi:hypothetical protein
MRLTHLLGIASAVFLLDGCAQKGQLYQWQDYDRQLYSYYKDPTTSKAFLLKLETQALALESAGQVPPPGIYAEIGTLYLEGGDVKTAASYYKKEAAAWPPSAPLMNTLVSALERPKQGSSK